MLARELMTANPFAVAESATVQAAARLMKEHDVGIIPVVRDMTSRRLEGVVTDRDITVRCIAEGRAPDGFVAAFMSKAPLATVLPEASAEDVLRVMERARVRRVPVVDADRRLLGIIALADVVRAMGRRSPDTVEEVLERVSESSRALV
jgi:CBS domain-containing protein